MLQALQKGLLVTSKIHLTRSMVLPMRYHSTNSTGDQPTIPDLSMKFAEILRSIKEYNDSLQNLENLSETIKENVNKYAEDNFNTRALYTSINSEIRSTIEKLMDGESKRVYIKDDIHEELQNKLKDISCT